MITMRNHVRTGLTSVMFLFATYVGNLPRIFAAPRPSDLPDLSAIADGHTLSKESALAQAYLIGNGVERDLKQAAYWYEKAAGLGDPVAQNQIGYLYEVGMGVPADQVRAVHWYQLAAAGGLTNAKVNLAVAYIWGMGAPKDEKTGERLLREAAAKGNAVAATYLGDMYFNGISVPKDEAEGKKWYEKAIKLHGYLAAYRMGMILSSPQWQSHDFRRALGLFRQAAAAGLVPAMHSLGLLLVNHPELCTSHEEALALLNDAAAAGTWQSSVVLGTLARDGKWVPQDPGQAYFHFSAGAIQGGDKAQKIVANDVAVLTRKLSAEERAQLDEQARAWGQEHAQLLSMLYKTQKTQPHAAVALVSPMPGSHAGALIPFSMF